MTKESFVRLLALAKLGVSDTEFDEMKRDFVYITGFVEKVNQFTLDTDRSAAEINCLASSSLRPDVPKESLPRKVVLAPARNKDKNGFLVSKMIWTGGKNDEIDV